MRIGQLPYLNAWPYFAAWPGSRSGSSGPRFITAPPRRLGEHAAAGELDAAPLASRDALALAESFRPLPFGVACDGPVGSVLLFSRFLPHQLGGRRVALSGESRTSRGLLRLLLAVHFEAEDIRYVDDPAPADARLVIGDAALTLARGGTLTPALSQREREPDFGASLPLSLGERGPGGEGSGGWASAWPHVVDLGAAWRDWTGLPFVYARWVVRRDRPRMSARLTLDLDRALRRAARLPRDLPPGVDTGMARAYLKRLTYRLGPREEAGYERFHMELERHGLLEHHSRTRRARRAA